MKSFKSQSRSNEWRIFGLQASLAAFNTRPNEIVKVFIAAKRVKECQKLIDWCTKNRKLYKIVSDNELSKITKSEHHEGLALTVKAKRILSVKELIEAFKTKKRARILMLAGVGNPHNIGAIIRSAAFFGTDAVILKQGLSLSGATARTAEGGLEALTLSETADFKIAIDQLKKADFKVLATSPHSEVNLYKLSVPNKVAVVFGPEGEGLSDELMQMSSSQVAIPGAGTVESLNVSCTVAVVLSELMRREISSE